MERREMRRGTRTREARVCGEATTRASSAQHHGHPFKRKNHTRILLYEGSGHEDGIEQGNHAVPQEACRESSKLPR
eukprot:798700-Amorphochlora_amoeboformis.AAC.1